MDSINLEQYRWVKTVKKASTGGNFIEYRDLDEESAIKALEHKKDPKSLRLKKMLAMPDLTRTVASPIKFVVDRITNIPSLRGLDVVKIPETVPYKVNFDWFDFPPDHPARLETDTYFLTPDRVLRTHTTSSWAYYLTDEEVLKKLDEKGQAGFLSYGKVYRKDEIDRQHYPVFHQIDGLYLAKKDKQIIDLKFLQDVIVEVVKSVFGEDVKWRFLDDTFPYTDPSTQTEIYRSGEWIEILGAGIARKSTLKNLGINPNVYNGWAFGFGLERLAMVKMEISDIRILWSEDPRITKQFTNIDSKYHEVSKYPSITRDVSFIVSRDFVPNQYFDLIRDVGGNLVEEVLLLDKYEDEEKFGSDKISYTYRIIYRSHERTLLNNEIDKIQDEIYRQTKKQFRAILR